MKWRDLYNTLDHSWITAVERLVARGIGKELVPFVLGEKPLWTDLEALAARHLSSPRAVCLAATYLYGATVRQHGEYVEVAPA